MRKNSLVLMMALALSCFASSALAQDEFDEMAEDPEAGFGGEASVESEGEGLAGDDETPSTAGSEKPFSAGLLLGYGISLEDGGNLWGLGFGVRGGYNIDEIFIGARFVYYLGEDPVNLWELGIEGGYDLAVGDNLTVRPGLGLGLANVTVDIPTIAGFGGGSASETYFYIAPGASLLYDINEKFFIGGEGRFQLVLSDPDSVKAITLLVNGGMRF
ncbi:MAG: hypothetical protein PVI30_26455 [Myxococcales bacterium]|jgi:opacity protein-like surface antigen